MGRDLSSAEFRRFHDLIYRIAGIHYPEAKRELLSNRIRRRLRAIGVDSFEAYLKVVERQGSPERQALLDEVTTNETYFFRCPRHWEHFRQWIRERAEQPQLLAAGVNVWSAAASNGAEACTILIVLDEVLGRPGGGARFGGTRVEVLATDLSAQILDEARQATFRPYALAQTPPQIVERYFKKNARDEQVFDRQLLRHVQFRQHNLMEPLAPRRAFDVVFLRNVMIYFDAASRARVLQHAFDVMKPGALLFVGESESLLSVEHGFRYVRPSIFVKPEPAALPRA